MMQIWQRFLKPSIRSDQIPSLPKKANHKFKKNDKLDSMKNFR